MEDTLKFMAFREIGWASRSRFTLGCVALFEISKGLFRSDFGDLTERMSPALNQPQGFPSSLRGPLHHDKGVFESLSKN